MSNIKKKFVTTSGNHGYGNRVWLHDEAPLGVHDILKTLCKWGGSDKREGSRVSYEMKRDINLDAVRAALRNYGMIEDNTSDTMRVLTKD